MTTLDKRFETTAANRARLALRLRRFSLIELLVVISLIAVLTSLLLPALSSAKNRSKSIKCASNLKNIGLYLQMYADMNNGAGCNYTGNVRAGVGKWQDALYACGISAPPVVMSDYCYCERNGLYSFKPRGVFSCPAEPETWYNPYTSAKHYGINGWIAGYGGKTWKFYARVQAPSGCAAVADIYRTDAEGGFTASDKQAASGNCSYVNYYHPGAIANFLFLDGHAAGMKSANVPWDNLNSFWCNL